MIKCQSNIPEVLQYDAKIIRRTTLSCFRKQHKKYNQSQMNQYNRKTAREANNSLTV